jgi:hypothetical protein
MQDVTNPVSLPPPLFFKDIPFLHDYVNLIFHVIGSSDLLHLSQAPHFKMFQVFFIDCLKFPSFSTIQKLCSNCSILLVSSLNLSPISW